MQLVIPAALKSQSPTRGLDVDIPRGTRSNVERLVRCLESLRGGRIGGHLCPDLITTLMAKKMSHRGHIWRLDIVFFNSFSLTCPHAITIR
ncbi:hypothetical protein CDAR_510261 [Caerostris darwini]|uniref:Uncharacterized protein n=1 Tax=Caerostris darwini TaxID=1538125 RepID=A0AAV4P5W2_9ARAC|nr:hypothetical protein CDAR_510261 [Caerostris darwini]